ncbi:hypothetical protein Plav_1601 [Parvibaculum lavamentivorans DS-1]|uniref:Lipoprotein n=1 Tax=Parvibaculum lavamentivorans (strain DS-1 / DSM 13023 / NCIMB 13966) TaxID=402881 RepID=A7HTI7_PARL1|nr:lipoprotein [Parvibaculum lavamentivorans]ABS63220.1 hypothetical protein Plav_1601 [Parvibaculum lavamentivorans DS-1]
MTTRHLTAAVLGLVLLTALSACGRKGPLELPPDANRAEAEPVQAEPVTSLPGEEGPVDAQPIDRSMNDLSPRGLRNY